MFSNSQQQPAPNMRTFLWFLLIVMVSGDGENVNVTTFLKGNVLLPCTCENLVLLKKIRWQKEKPATPVWSNMTTSTNYKDRVETFFNTTTNNCSILLKNITEDDQGKYRCSFNNPTYQRKFVNLQVCDTQAFTNNLESNPVGNRVMVFVLVPAGLILFVFVIFLRKRLNQMKLPCCRDLEQNHFWERKISEGEKNEKEMLAHDVL